MWNGNGNEERRCDACRRAARCLRHALVFVCRDTRIGLSDTTLVAARPLWAFSAREKDGTALATPIEPIMQQTPMSEFQTSLAELVPALRARAIRLCADRSAAEDLVQDTMERALRFSSQYERGTNVRAWVFQILFSVFVSGWRRRRRERNAITHLASDPCAWTVPNGCAAPDAGEGSLSRATRQKLDSLPEGFRAVVRLVDLEEHSYRDAALQLGVPVGTVMSRLHRARKLLAEQMAA